jgi:hypothetical protein
VSASGKKWYSLGVWTVTPAFEVGGRSWRAARMVCSKSLSRVNVQVEVNLFRTVAYASRSCQFEVGI